MDIANRDHRLVHDVLADASAEVLAELETIAQATLGRQVHDSEEFRNNCRRFGLGDALNLEHDWAD